MIDQATRHLQPYEATWYVAWGLLCSEFAHLELIIDENLLWYSREEPDIVRQVKRKFPNQMKEKLRTLALLHSASDREFPEDLLQEGFALFEFRNHLTHGKLFSIVFTGQEDSIRLVRRTRNKSKSNFFSITISEIKATAIHDVLDSLICFRDRLVAENPKALSKLNRVLSDVK